MTNYKKLILSMTLADALEWNQTSEKTLWFCEVTGLSVNHSQFDYYLDNCEAILERLLKRSVTLPIADVMQGKDATGKPAMISRLNGQRLTDLYTLSGFPVTLSRPDSDCFGVYCADPFGIEAQTKITNGSMLVIGLRTVKDWRESKSV